MKHRRLNLPRKWLIFTVTATGTFMGTLDGGIVNIALPSMARQFGADIESIQTVVSIYLLAVTCFLPVFGKLSDMFSRKKLYLGGFLLFGIGSLFCSVAGSLPLMIAARAVQGLGASAMMANAQAIIAKAFVGKDRGRALGGSMTPIEELRAAGVDMSTPRPVCEALDYCAELVLAYGELEA